jgi:hypothetical protein
MSSFARTGPSRRAQTISIDQREPTRSMILLEGHERLKRSGGRRICQLLLKGAYFSIGNNRRIVVGE